jgi:hypothetical protein
LKTNLLKKRQTITDRILVIRVSGWGFQLFILKLHTGRTHR